MNYSMVKILILKDWYLQRNSILVSLGGGALALAIIATTGNAGFIMGIIILVTALVAIGVNLAMATIVNERQEHTLPFIMSLPISPREYSAAKILGNLLIFLVPWISILAGSISIILYIPGLHRGMIPFVSIMAAEILVSTCFIVTVALVTESQRWTVGVQMVGNLAFIGFGYFVGHLASIIKFVNGPRIVWNYTALSLLISEFACVVLLLSLTFFIQDRKTDFL